jgi:ubiquinone/menaquinone biosynthesis C-methylase UbiE
MINEPTHFDVSKAARLDNEGRTKELRIPELLREVGRIKGGTLAVDLGAGTGTFALRLAPLLGTKGKAYAVDDSADMLGILKSRNPPPNLIPIKADFTATGLESGIADFCLAAFVLHETRAPEKLLAEAYRLLKPGGTLLVVEWRAEFDSPGPPQKIRITAERMVELFAGAGFKDFQSANWSEKHYYGRAQKPRAQS